MPRCEREKVDSVSFRARQRGFEVQTVGGGHEGQRRGSSEESSGSWMPRDGQVRGWLERGEGYQQLASTRRGIGCSPSKGRTVCALER